MNNIVKNAIIFSAGVVVGAITGIQLVKGKYAAMAEEEIEAMRDYNRKKKRSDEEHEKKEGTEDQASNLRKTDRRKPVKADLTEKGNYKKIARRYSNYDEEAATMTEKEKSDAQEEYNKHEKMSADANSGEYREPYVITLEQFSDECTHYDKENLYYYAGDDSLCDVDEDLISDVRGLIGNEALDNFDHNTVYVRNERLNIDYEIILVNGKYSELVVGMIDEK